MAQRQVGYTAAQVGTDLRLQRLEEGVKQLEATAAEDRTRAEAQAADMTRLREDLSLLANRSPVVLPTDTASLPEVDPAALPYAMVKVTPDVESILERNSIRIGRVFVDRRGPAEIRFGIGDTVSVTIFEAAAGGLFIPVDAGVRKTARIDKL